MDKPQQLPLLSWLDIGRPRSSVLCFFSLVYSGLQSLDCELRFVQ